MPILSTTGASSAKAYGFSGAIIVPGNSGILTTGTTSFTLPTTSGPKINILVVGGGGGGGGGSARRTNGGYSTGGGGGGAAGNAYISNVAVIPGQTITLSIGSGGGGGGAGDGIYSSSSPGQAGGSTSVTINGSVVAQVSGGGGGAACPNPAGAAGGTVVTGTQLLSPTSGSDAPSGTSAGGNGAKGYTVDTGVLVTSSLGYGTSGTGYPHGSTSAASGTIYGAAGSGGGTAQSDIEPYANIGGSAGTTGVVVIWWGLP